MIVETQKKFAVEIVYNGVTKPFEVESEERVAALLQQAIAVFRITQQPHLLSLFRQDGTLVPEGESVERAGLKPHEVLLLRPNAVKGGGGRLHLAAHVMSDTFGVLRRCGRGVRECAVFWTGPTDGQLVDNVEHPRHTSSIAGYQIDDSWLTAFWLRLAASRRSVKVQVHTHPGLAFHSAVDDGWPIVSHEGFLSIVIPNFATGEASLDCAWVGQLQANGRWRQLACPAEAISA